MNLIFIKYFKIVLMILTTILLLNFYQNSIRHSFIKSRRVLSGQLEKTIQICQTNISCDEKKFQKTVKLFQLLNSKRNMN